MLTTIDIINARISGYSGLQQVRVKQGVITAIAPSLSPDSTAPQLDVDQDWISLGGVDLQINGALGLAFPEVQPEDAPTLEAISQHLWATGVDGYVPTLVTTALENFHRALGVLTAFTPNSPVAAQILGVHLEGPCLNPAKKGAHPPEYLLPLTLDHIKRVLGDYTHGVQIVTLAPELETTSAVIPYLVSHGITVSLGHSLATLAEAERAFQQGATMVTHAFNAMPGLHHRDPGLLGTAITHPGVSCGLIADGQHVCPTMLDILLRACRGDVEIPGQLQGVFLVSDALAPLGLPDGRYPWDSRQIEVTQGTARLLDGTLSGTTLPLLVGAHNLVTWGLCSVDEAIWLATEAPRQAIGLPGFAVGHPATLLRWHLDDTTQTLTWQRLG